MISFFANIFGYLLNAIYIIFKNYGVSIILFSIIIKLLLLPISIKQQKTMKKSAKLQEKLKILKFKYQNDNVKLNQEISQLYKEEKMSPFSGCLSAIIQFIILISLFYLVQSPLTYMKKIDSNIIENYKKEISQQKNNERLKYSEISIIQEKGKNDERVNINMNFLGLDLSKVPTQSLNDFKVYIIPILYVISSFVSIKITNNMQNKMKDNKKTIIENGDQKTDEMEAMEQANKSMMLLMPIMSVSIAIISPLGLALYWLVSNILMILERITLEKYFDFKEEKNNA